MRWAIIPLFLLKGALAFSQDKQLEGIIFEKDTKERLARINILNLNTGALWYNNLKGEFRIDAKPGDKIVFSKEDYLADTLVVKNMASVIIYLQRTAIMLKEVTIRDSMHTPLQRLLATKREYSKAYGSNAYNNPFSTAPGGGAGLNLDALYNSLSRNGRNAQHLQELIQSDYEQNVIDYRFNRSIVGNITKLKDQELSDFMRRYRPSYFTVTNDTEYEFIVYIRTSLRRFLKIKRTNTSPPRQTNTELNPAKIVSED
jgi:hypothetical protein